MTRKEFRQHRKMVKQYQRKLIKIAKEWGPYDYYNLLSFMYISLQGMREYYDKGINVWSMETKEWGNPDIPTRKEICEMLINCFEDDGVMEDPIKLNEFFDLLKKYIYELWD